MIKYALQCAHGHRFEAWFKDSASADRQIGDGLASCPVCGDVRVAKALMAPAVASRERTTMTTIDPGPDQSAPAPAQTDAPPSAPPSAPPPTLTPEAARRAMQARLRAFRAFVEANAENAGRKFPEVARAIHEGREEERPIWGECTPEEAIELVEDGVPCAPLPPVEPLDD